MNGPFIANFAMNGPFINLRRPDLADILHIARELAVEHVSCPGRSAAGQDSLARIIPDRHDACRSSHQANSM
jgi:hypothetical protein